VAVVCVPILSNVETVTVDLIVQNLLKNVETSKTILKKAISSMPEKRGCSCSHALENAIITAHDRIPQAARKRLDIIIGKYVKQAFTPDHRVDGSM